MPTIGLNLDLVGYVEPPPPGQGLLEVHAYFLGLEVSAEGTVDTLVFTTPATLSLAAGAYTVKVTYMGQAKTFAATVAEGQTARVDATFSIAVPEETYPFLLAGGGVLAIALIYSATRKKKGKVEVKGAE